jgi:hypothetical protein
MRFSLRSTFIAVAWIAWLLAALTVQHGLVPELFVLAQFATLAVAMSLALNSTARLKLFGVCFTAGFLSWFSLLAAESWFCDTQLFRYTPAGSRLGQIAGLFVDENTSPDSLTWRMNTTISVIRSTFGSAIGILTYVVVSRLMSDRVYGHSE